MRLQFLIVGFGVLLMAGKFLAYLLTGSTAILSDAMESIVNVVGGLFSAYALWLSSRPKDKEHPYGHGKVEFLSSGFEGGLILMAGLAIIYQSIQRLLEPQALKSLDYGILLTLGAGLANLLMGLILEKRGKANNSPAMITSGKHLQSDAWSSAGLLVGLGLIWFTEVWWLDSVVAILFAFVIIVTGYREVQRSINGILDAADFEVIRNLLGIVSKNRRENWIDLHNLRVIRYGPNLHIDCHVTLPRYLTVDEGHQEIEDIRLLLTQQHEQSIEIFIHADPCVPTSCKICDKQNCPVRSEPLRELLTWDLDNAVSNQKHGL